MCTSNAPWINIPQSTDTHDAKEQAQCVCEMLSNDYGGEEGCYIRGRCTSAWMTEDECNTKD